MNKIAIDEYYDKILKTFVGWVFDFVTTYLSRFLKNFKFKELPIMKISKI
jgi:hypothetical protein